MTQGLFREQSVEFQRQRLHGEVVLLPKMSHTVIIFGLVVWVFIVFVWLITGNFARKETVTGWLEPTKGVVRIYPESNGLVNQIMVKEGDTVVKSQPIIIIKSAATMSSGENLELRITNELETQKKLLSSEIIRTKNIFDLKLKEIANKRDSALQDLKMLEIQKSNLSLRLDLVGKQQVRFNTLKDRGYASNSDLDRITEQELSVRNEHQIILNEIEIRKNLLQQYSLSMQMIPEESSAALSLLETKKSQIDLQIDELNIQGSRMIRAPSDGVVDNLQARIGQRVYSGKGDVPLLTIVPSDDVLFANLLVPVRSSGFLQKGQEITIRYDAFPYQKFGLYSGTIQRISETIFMPNELTVTPLPVDGPVYLVSVQLDSSNVSAYGKKFPLKSGMTISADIKLDERSLMQWFLEPIYSLKGNL
jgi:membrane fusion protein